MSGFQFKNVVLESDAFLHPPEILTSDQIEWELSPLYKRLKLPTGRLELMTGIMERRLWPVGTMPSGPAVEVANNLLEEQQIAPEEVDLLIFASVCRDHLEPATASIVHHQLNLSPGTPFFDLSNACLGVLNGQELAAKLIEGGQIKRALVVACENASPLIRETIKILQEDKKQDRQSIKKFFSNFTLGSGAYASTIAHRAHSKNASAPLFEFSHHLAATDQNHLCQGSGDVNKLQMQTDSSELLQRGIELAQANWELFKKFSQWENDTPDTIVTHQVGLEHQKALYHKLELDVSKDFCTFPQWGNTGSVALPMTLAQAHREKKIKAPHRVACLGIGSGLSSIILGLSW